MANSISAELDRIARPGIEVREMRTHSRGTEYQVTALDGRFSRPLASHIEIRKELAEILKANPIGLRWRNLDQWCVGVFVPAFPITCETCGEYVCDGDGPNELPGICDYCATAERDAHADGVACSVADLAYQSSVEEGD